MKRRLVIAVFALFILTSVPLANAEGPKPNIIFILTDDLGYGDLGVLYQNRPRARDFPRMTTPHLDRMAREGMILRQHYTGSPVCAPARASLLLGQHQGDCPIRDNQFDKALPHNHTIGNSPESGPAIITGAIGKMGFAGRRAGIFRASPPARF